MQALVSDVTARNECQYCGSFVTRRFRQVYGDENQLVYRCRECDSDARLKKGSAAGNDVAYPDPQDHGGRNGGVAGGARR